MKVCLLNSTDFSFSYPQDMRKILKYLKQNGELFIKEKTVEEYYYKFSEEYYCVGWLSLLGDESRYLKEFAEYLNNVEI